MHGGGILSVYSSFLPSITLLSFLSVNRARRVDVDVITYASFDELSPHYSFILHPQ